MAKTPPVETAAGREKARSQGAALPPLPGKGNKPRYPTPNRTYLGKAIRAVGRSKTSHAGIRAYLIRRARALGAMDMIPDDWKK